MVSVDIIALAAERMVARERRRSSLILKGKEGKEGGKELFGM
jgi:hypothetical protein